MKPSEIPGVRNGVIVDASYWLWIDSQREAARRMVLDIIYPVARQRSGAGLVQDAKDQLATAYLKAHPGADPAAVDENSRVTFVVEAMEILHDAGVYRFSQDSWVRARGLES